MPLLIPTRFYQPRGAFDGSSVVGPPTVTFITEVNAGVGFSGNSAFYTGVGIGTASSDRFLIVAFTSIQSGVGNAVTDVSLKVSGQSDIAMTFSGATIADANGTVVIAWASVPAAYGTTGDVWLTTNAGFANSPALATYTTLISTMSSTTPTDKQSNSSSSSTSINKTLTTGAGGFIVAAGVNGVTTGATGSFNNAPTALPTDAGATFAAGRHTFGSLNSVSGTSNTVTFTQNGSADQMAFTAVAWR